MTFSGIVKSGCAAALLVVLTLGLGGCGRRGDLEVPGAPSAKSGDATAVAPNSVIDGTSPPAQSGSKPIAPKRDFLLDPLL